VPKIEIAYTWGYSKGCTRFHRESYNKNWIDYFGGSHDNLENDSVFRIGSRP